MARGQRVYFPPPPPGTLLSQIRGARCPACLAKAQRILKVEHWSHARTVRLIACQECGYRYQDVTTTRPPSRAEEEQIDIKLRIDEGVVRATPQKAETQNNEKEANETKTESKSCQRRAC